MLKQAFADVSEVSVRVSCGGYALVYLHHMQASPGDVFLCQGAEHLPGGAAAAHGQDEPAARGDGRPSLHGDDRGSLSGDLPAFEWLFKITTDVRLLELSNLNAPILRRLAVEAPGTYHHSLMVRSLGEAAAESIGASAILVRVGAYFHDIGKVLKPEYFVENQAFGLNRHEALSPSMSCLVIASHVKDGLELAVAAGLPQVIRDMIPQHHGTRVMSYFYQKAKNAGDPRDGDVSEESFRYPGPRPQSREAAIIMLADAVEAASHTLTSPTPGRVQAMIDRIVDSIVADHQLDECHMTFREVTLIKESFLKILTGIRHRRISYPGYEFNERAQEPADETPSRPGVKQTASF